MTSQQLSQGCMRMPEESIHNRAHNKVLPIKQNCTFGYRTINYRIQENFHSIDALGWLLSRFCLIWYVLLHFTFSWNRTTSWRFPWLYSLRDMIGCLNKPAALLYLLLKFAVIVNNFYNWMVFMNGLSFSLGNHCYSIESLKQ